MDLMSFRPEYKRKVKKTDLQKIFWRSIPLNHSWNYERMANVGFAWALMPLLKKLYPQKKDFSNAMKRHLELYNVTQYISTFPMGIAAAMEEENSLKSDFDESSISNVKTALMGPLSGIGDSFFWGTIRVIATGVSIQLALQGNILGPILFFLIFNTVHYLFRYYGTFLGYGLGTNVISEVEQSGLMSKLTKYASIVGMIVVGAMTMDMVKVNFVFKVGSTKTGGSTIQSLLNGIFPGIPVLLVFGLTYWLLKKKLNPLWIMLIMLLLSIAGAYFKLLG